MLFPLERHSSKATMRMKSYKKAYVVDNGFVTAKAVQHSPDTGKLMENLVFAELVKRGYKPGHELFYYKSKNDREVDFVLKKGYQVTELLQVCYDLTGPDVEQREVKALLEAGKELGVSNLVILTWNEEREITKDGLTIQVRPLWKWLLEDEK